MHKELLPPLVAMLLALGAVTAAHAGDGVVRIGVLIDQSGVFADGTGAGSTLAARMAAEDFGGEVKGLPIEVIAGDHLNKPDVGASIANGRKVHDVNVFQVKTPEESKSHWDLYKVSATIPGDRAFLTLAQSGCAPQ